MLIDTPIAVETPVTQPYGTEVAPSSYPADLSRREVEVICLMAQGLTHAQSARQLTISPFTVNAHMRSIYQKLGLSSRIAIMRQVDINSACGLSILPGENTTITILDSVPCLTYFHEFTTKITRKDGEPACAVY
jgi:DNA-binding CsgD family transcriptional regulator